MTPSGIEPATFRFVAQYLNHCATAVPAFGEYCSIVSLDHVQKSHILLDKIFDMSVFFFFLMDFVVEVNDADGAGVLVTTF
jgi:hypothetical protein